MKKAIILVMVLILLATLVSAQISIDTKVDKELVTKDFEENEQILIGTTTSDGTKYDFTDLSVKSIEFKDLNIQDGDYLGVEDVYKKINPFKKVYAINPSNLDFSTADVTVTATGNAVFKCTDWNFTQQECLGEWKLLKRTIPGENYTFTIDANDPGFGEINITEALYLDENKTLIQDITNETIVKDDVWSPPIYHNQWIEATYQESLYDGFVVDVYLRNNQSLNTTIEIYQNNTLIGKGPSAMLPEQLYYIGLFGVVSDANPIYIKIVNQENNTGAYLEFDYIHDASPLSTFNGNFTEGFESGSFILNGWYTEGSGSNNWSVGTTPHTGTYNAQVSDSEGETTLTTNISTFGWADINLSYWRQLVGHDPADYFYSQWYNGTNWITLENVSDENGAYTKSNYLLDASANNNPNLKIRFGTDIGSITEYSRVDDINLFAATGLPPDALFIVPLTGLNANNFRYHLFDGVFGFFENRTRNWTYDENIVRNYMLYPSPINNNLKLLIIQEESGWDGLSAFVWNAKDRSFTNIFQRNDVLPAVAFGDPLTMFDVDYESLSGEAILAYYNLNNITVVEFSNNLSINNTETTLPVTNSGEGFVDVEALNGTNEVYIGYSTTGGAAGCYNISKWNGTTIENTISFCSIDGTNLDENYIYLEERPDGDINVVVLDSVSEFSDPLTIIRRLNTSSFTLTSPKNFTINAFPNGDYTQLDMEVIQDPYYSDRMHIFITDTRLRYYYWDGNTGTEKYVSAGSVAHGQLSWDAEIFPSLDKIMIVNNFLTYKNSYVIVNVSDGNLLVNETNVPNADLNDEEQLLLSGDPRSGDMYYSYWVNTTLDNIYYLRYNYTNSSWGTKEVIYDYSVIAIYGQRPFNFNFDNYIKFGEDLTPPPPTNTAPTILIVNPTTTSVVLPVFINWTGSDPENDTLQYSLWLYKGGTLNETFLINSSETEFTWRTGKITGDYNITVQACEVGTSELYCDQDSIIVTLNNSNPVIENLIIPNNVTPISNSTVFFNVTFDVTDVNGLTDIINTLNIFSSRITETDRIGDCTQLSNSSTMLYSDIFYDDFNRQDSNTVGNGWVEDETSPEEIRIENNEIIIDGGGDGDNEQLSHDFNTSKTYYNISFIWQVNDTFGFQLYIISPGGTLPRKIEISGALGNWRWVGLNPLTGCTSSSGSQDTGVAIVPNVPLEHNIIINETANRWDWYINGSLADGANCMLENGPWDFNNISFMTITSTKINVVDDFSIDGSSIDFGRISYSCELNHTFYDEPGVWDVNVTATDFSGGIGSNTSESYTLLNLDSIFVDDNIINFIAPLTTSHDVQGDTITFFNLGNQDYNIFNFTAYNLTGKVTGANLGAENFCSNQINDANTGCDTLSHATAVGVGGAALPRGASSTESIYNFVDLPGVALENYNATTLWSMLITTT